MVDGCTDDESIAQVFACKYMNYTSVPYDVVELNSILADIDADISQSTVSDLIIHARDIQDAISKLNLHKTDGDFNLSSDHFVNAGADLSVHISRLFLRILLPAQLYRFRRRNMAICPIVIIFVA